MLAGLYIEKRDGELEYTGFALPMSSAENAMVGDYVDADTEEYRIVKRKWVGREEGSLLLIVEPAGSGVVLA